MRNVSWFICLILSATVMYACIPAPEVSEMIPSTTPSTILHSDKVLRVGEVTGGKKTNPMMESTIDNAGFRQAMVETLQKSGLFRSVIIDQAPADFELQTEIISQDVQGMYDKMAVLFVHYSLVDASSQQVIWKENLISRYLVKFEETVFVLDRRKIANEGVVRENLNLLVERLSQVLPQGEPTASRGTVSNK